MKKIKMFIASSIFALLIPSQAFSATGHVNDATITGLYCGYDGSFNMCSVLFNKTIVGADPDGCNTITANRMQFKGDTDMGKAILAVALTAYTTQKLVTIHSTGLCDVYPGLLDIRYIELL